MDVFQSQNMKIALREAKGAVLRNEVPVGAVITNGNTGELIARASNHVEQLHDPTAHAEILAIRKACAVLDKKWLDTCDMYVTSSLAPCALVQFHTHESVGCTLALWISKAERLKMALGFSIN